jgi:RecJ-like exonuclease
MMIAWMLAVQEQVLRQAADVGYEATYKRLLGLGKTELAARRRSSAATAMAGDVDVTVKCRGCDGKGRAAKEQPCPSCAGKPEGLGRIRCEAKGFTLKLEACPPCGDCSRLGVRISVNQGEAPGH